MAESLIGPLSYPAINTTLWDRGAFQKVGAASHIVLVCDVVNGAGESRYSALRVPGAAAGYQVTTGKTLYLTYVRFYGTAASSEWLVVSGTADAGDSQIAAPAGVKSENSRADGVPAALNIVTAMDPVEFRLWLNVAADRFPAVRCLTQNTSLYIFAVGHEE